MILVTGAAGSSGSAVIREFPRRNAAVFRGDSAPS
jgi:uncharacterized protein YbjT (DUF2867 family)